MRLRADDTFVTNPLRFQLGARFRGSPQESSLFPRETYGCVLVTRLSRMWIENAGGKLVHLAIMHRNKNLSWLHNRRDHNLCANAPASRNDSRKILSVDAEACRVGWIDFDIALGWRKGPQNIALV